MLKSCLSHSIPRSLNTPTRVACLHTSTPILARGGSRKRNPQALKKENQQLKAQREERAAARRPHVVLGTIPGDTTSWPTSDLAKSLLDVEVAKGKGSQKTTVKKVGAEEQEDSSVYDTALGRINLPPAFRFGVSERERTLLLDTLPSLSSELGADSIVSASSTRFAGSSHTYSSFSSESGVPAQSLDKMSPDELIDLEKRRSNAEVESGQKELEKAQMLATLLDLRNSDAKGVAFENRRRIIQEFSTPENPFDTGRAEVQAALLTYKIRNLWTHLTTFKKDVGNRRALRKLVHQRAKILKYLRKTDRYRYDSVLERLALDPASVEGELVV